MPVVDDAARLAATLPLLASQLAVAEKTLGKIELIIIDDASRDDTVHCINDHLDRFRQGHLIRLPWSCGSGTAARAGVAAASGETISFIDEEHRADVHRLMTIVRLLKDADVLVSPRSVAAPHATLNRRVSYGAYDRLASRLIPASQPVGRHRIAALRREVAKPLFSLLQSHEFAFDIEARVVATSMGLHVVELPVALAEVGTEKSQVARDRTGVRSMVRDLVRANGHRSRALSSRVARSGLSPSADTDQVIDLTADESGETDNDRDAPMRRQNRAGA